MDDSHAILAGSGQRRGARLPKRFNKILLGLVLLSCIVFICVVPLPDLLASKDVRDAAEYYDTPVSSVRSAQQVANLYRMADIFPGVQHRRHRHVPMTKIDSSHSGGAKGYMDVPEGCEATVMLVRHCEKGEIREHCTYTGYERSVYLASLFGHDSERWPLPSFIFAMSPTSRNNRHKMNFREIETVGPLASKAGIKIDDSFTSRTKDDLTSEILAFLQTGELCGKLTVVSWKHSEIAHIARHLGCGPLQVRASSVLSVATVSQHLLNVSCFLWPLCLHYIMNTKGCPIDYRGRDFDSVWQIKFVYRTLDHSTRHNLRLPTHPEWRVYGSVQPENFDPLAVSKKYGDYQVGKKDGARFGTRWQDKEWDIPERQGPRDHGGWKATRIGFDNNQVTSPEADKVKDYHP